MPDGTPDPRLEEALRHLHPPAGFDPWHGGASMLGSLRGVTPEVAAWKPPTTPITRARSS